MSSVVIAWFKRMTAKLTGSIAFLPALIAVAYLLLFWGMITLDGSVNGKHIKATWQWLHMRDAATARLVAATIAGGMLSFTVFSFSMVMIVLNQTASKMSNRILETIIRNRFQQLVLGCYIGTVIYSIFLVTAIRDIDTGVYVPALSTYLLILFAIVDIFLFIYFLHFVTQFAKYQTLIHHIHSLTLHRLKQQARTKRVPPNQTFNFEQTVPSPRAGYFEGCNEKAMVSLPVEEAYHIAALYPPGSFVLKGTDLLHIKSNMVFTATVLREIENAVAINRQPTFAYFLSGFNQLSEVALKALSPGINDPATAVLSLHALSDLFCYLFNHPLSAWLVNAEEGKVFSYSIPTIEELLTAYLLPVWDYGKGDRTIQQALIDMVQQLLRFSTNERTTDWLAQFLSQVKLEGSKQFEPLK